jgi:hypothetical protein
MNASFTPLHHDRKHVMTNFLMEGAWRLQCTELSVFGKPEPGTERIVSRAKDFRAAGCERSKPPVRTPAFDR